MAVRRYVDIVGTIGSGNLTNVATTHTFTAPLTYGAGVTLPTLTGSDHFMLTILSTTGRVSEIVKVTAYNSGTGAATIVRAQEGTTGVSHNSGDKVTNGAYPSDLNEGLPFAQQPVATSINNIVTYPAVGAATTLHTITGAGVVRNYMLTNGSKDMAKNGHIQFFVDGETYPSIDVEVGTLFGAQEDAWASQGKMLSNDHVMVSLSGTPYTGTSQVSLLLPIPFSNGLIVKFYNPSVTPASTLFSTLAYQVGAVPGLTDRYRLRSACGEFRRPKAGVKDTSLPLFDLSTTPPGWLAYFATAVDAVTDYSFLERPWNVYVDGEGTPSYRGNAEDWWGSGYYHGGNILNYDTASTIVTAANNANFTFYGGVDLLSQVGGLKFTTGLKMAFGAASETKAGGVFSGGTSWENTAFSLGYVALYYVDTATTFTLTVPAAPTIGTATAGASSTSVAFTAPSDGGVGITGYTVTSTPGGVVGEGTSSPITVSGLTGGTAYTFKVKATNPLGTGPESAASNSVTPPIALDSFTRANNASSLGTADSGQTYTVACTGAGTAVAGISSNQAYFSSITASQGGFATINAGVADATVQVTMSAAYTDAGLTWRYADINNNFGMNKTGVGRRVAGAYVTVATFSTPFTTGDVIKVILSGNTHTVYRNGASVASFTDSNHNTATRHGISAFSDTAARFDDFSISA